MRWWEMVRARGIDVDCSQNSRKKEADTDTDTYTCTELISMSIQKYKHFVSMEDNTQLSQIASFSNAFDILMYGFVII